MSKGVTITREKDAIIPLDFLAKAHAENRTGLGFAIVKDGGSRVVVRRALQSSAKAADEFQRSDGLKDVPIIIHFASSPVQAEDDLQPFTLLQNEDESIALVCFMDGDFSAYEQPNSSKSSEYWCVEKAIIPRIDKLVNLCNGDIDKIMDALNDDLTAQDWANFMLGSRGSITLVAYNGRMITIVVEGDTTQKSFDGWWTSNSYGYGEQPATLAESAGAELSGNANQTKPTLKLPVSVKRPVASTTPITSPVPGTGPQPEVAPNGPTSPQPPGPDLGDPDTVIEISIPSNMETKRAFKWISQRMPQGMVPTAIAGLKVLRLKRKDANPKFLQTFMEQNKLSGLAALKGSTTSVPSTQAATSPVLPPASQEKGYPERAQEAQPQQPATSPPIVEPGKEGDKQPSVVTEPLPVLSPRQIEETINFANDPAIKLVIDAHGKIIASPHGLEQMESRVASLSKQFGGKLSILDIAKWPLDTFLQYSKHDPQAAGTIAFCLATELQKAYKLMDGLTEPQKKEEPATPQPQQQVPQPAGYTPGRRKVA